MMPEISQQSPRDWAIKHFAGAELSDLRRVDRAITIAEAMAASPGASLPQIFAHPYDLKAAYQFFKHAEATPDNLQAGHREHVLLEMETPGRYLLLEDTSEILASANGAVAGLGPIGSSKQAQIGFLLHSVLALRWPAAPDQRPPRRPTVEILGLADQQSHVRRPRPAGTEPFKSARRRRPATELETSLWEQAARRVGAAPARPDIEWIKVSDRGADIYDHHCECQKQKQRFITRAKQDRILVNAAGKRSGKLFATLQASASCGEMKLELRTRRGQARRTATLKVSFQPVLLRSTQVVGHAAGTRPALACTAIRVWEAQPPAGVKALEWVLLTDLPVSDFEQACEIAQMYATRWLEEEFHKALKTGMDAESLQLATAHEWFAAMALKSVAALRLLQLREQMRLEPQAPAACSGLNELELAVLRARSGKPLLTVQEVALAIGRLGGHLNRKSDGQPGWITLWRGWQVLQTLVEGALITRKLTKFG
jgi:hypothetical protein